MTSASNSTPILYHYPMSPFSEKIRATMGVLDAEWHSVTVPAFPPRSDLSPFIGGYRRIPVLQVGAQFYCDSQLAYDALVERTSELRVLSPEDEHFRQWAETDVFFAVLSAQKPSTVMRFLIRELGVRGFLYFVRDRARMMRVSALNVLSTADSSNLIERYVAALSERLVDQAFLSGLSPRYLDVCCYHPLWMAERVNSKACLHWPEPVRAWANRMQALGHGSKLSTSDGDIEAAIRSDEVDTTDWSLAPGWRLGEAVVVSPLDYGLDPSCGQLASLCDKRIVIRRRAPSGASIYLHFPRTGFSVMRR